MLLWERKIPDYLTDRKNIVSFILFTAVFALVFINIYAPFGVDKWLIVNDWQLFVYSSIVILIGMLVIVISRVLMFLFTRKNAISFGKYALWIVGEISVLALVYTLIQWFFLHVGNDFIVLLKNALRITAFIILLPYVIFWLYVSFKDKYTILEKIQSGKSAKEIKDMHKLKPFGLPALVSFYDEKGILKFSIKKEDLLFIEAADNYVFIHYMDNQKPLKYLIRNNLKHIETALPGGGLVRCHRSFMVNIENVKVIRKEKEGFIIGFESNSNIKVPISKTYLEPFIRKLSNIPGLDENQEVT
jgi:DNA-binding LytR/AlgR family response regulator